MNRFERHLTLWVGLCIIGGIALEKVAPDLATLSTIFGFTVMMCLDVGLG